MRALIIGVAFLLCAAYAKAEDIKSEFDRVTMQVTVIYYDDKRALNLEYPGKFYDHGVLGFTEYYTDRCYIHVIRPTLVDGRRTRSLGHELLHCFHGHYHE